MNQAGIDFYSNVIDCLLEHGIQPFMTLYHFDLPYALVEKYNGWEDRRCVYAFERYAKLCFEKFGGRVKYWQVITLPLTITGRCARVIFRQMKSTRPECAYSVAMR